MYANQFAAHDHILRVHWIAHGTDPKKSDAFLLEYDGNYTMIDGGMEHCDASLHYLRQIRRTLLIGHEDLQDASDCPLKLNVMISHCHRDHVGALHTEIFPSPMIELDTLYMPPDSRLDEKYGLNGDRKYRPLLEKSLQMHQPQARVIDIGFGKENMLAVPMGSEVDSPIITLCPPVINSAAEERIACMIEALGSEENPNIPTLVLNNNSVWIHVRHGQHTFLFTGDTVKKGKSMGYEMIEDMIGAYAELLGQVDVIKYVHHGFKRNHAAPAMMSLEPRYIVLTTALATADEVIREKFPESDVKLLNCGVRTYVFACDGEHLTVTPEV